MPAIPEAASASGFLVVRVVDASGTMLAGACFAVSGPRDFDRCDGGEGDSLDGQTLFPDMPPGEYVVEESSVRAGIAPAPAQRVTIEEGRTTELEIVHETK